MDKLCEYDESLAEVVIELENYVDVPSAEVRRSLRQLRFSRYAQLGTKICLQNALLNLKYAVFYTVSFMDDGYRKEIYVTQFLMVPIPSIVHSTTSPL